MALIVVEDILPDPMHVGLLGAKAIMPGSQGLAYLIQGFRFCERFLNALSNCSVPFVSNSFDLFGEEQKEMAYECLWKECPKRLL